MKDKKRLRIEAEVAKLPLLFAHYADNGDHQALADLFTGPTRDNANRES